MLKQLLVRIFAAAILDAEHSDQVYDICNCSMFSGSNWSINRVLSTQTNQGRLWFENM
jgi:hypothetical protein